MVDVNKTSAITVVVWITVDFSYIIKRINDKREWHSDKMANEWLVMDLNILCNKTLYPIHIIYYNIGEKNKICH